MAFIKPSLDQHSGRLIDVFAQGQTDHSLVSDAFFPLPLCLLLIAHFPFLPEHETNSRQKRPYAPSREISRRAAWRILSHSLPVSSRRARRRRACRRSRIAPRVGGAGCWRRLVRPWWGLHVRAGTMRHWLVRPGRGVGLRPESSAGSPLS